MEYFKLLFENNLIINSILIMKKNTSDKNQLKENNILLFSIYIIVHLIVGLNLVLAKKLYLKCFIHFLFFLENLLIKG